MANEEPRITPVIGNGDGALRRVEPKNKRFGSMRTDDISVRSGNVMFSFGFPGSGKTTFQWFLMNYLMNEGDFATNIVIPDADDGSEWEGRRIINDWKQLWIQGRFPEATKTNEEDIREVRCRVQPRTGRKTELEFSFLEMSGELLKAAMPQVDKRPELVPTLRAYLKNPRINLVLVLLLHPEREENDLLFPSLMSFLNKEFPGIADRMSLAIILSKPEQSLRRLQQFGSVDGRFDYDKFDAISLEDYLNRFCGETYQIWRTWPDPKRTMLSPLYIGEVTQEAGEQKLVEPDFRHIEQIFAWIFEQFTHVQLGQTWWQRFKAKLAYK